MPSPTMYSVKLATLAPLAFSSCSMVCLPSSALIKAEDGKQTIEQLLKAKGASVASFTLYMVGEGIEKKVDDFAAEVAAQAAAAAAKK